MAADKFRRMLNRELSVLSRGSKEGLSISNHITSTYTGRKVSSRRLSRITIIVKSINTSMSSLRRMKQLKIQIQFCGKKAMLGMLKVSIAKLSPKSLFLMIWLCPS